MTKMSDDGTNARGRPRKNRNKTDTRFVGAFFGQLRRLEDAARRANGRQPLSQATLGEHPKVGAIQTVIQRFERGERGESLVPRLIDYWGNGDRLAGIANKLVLGQLPDGTPATVEKAITLADEFYAERDRPFVEAASVRGVPVRSKQEAVELFERLMDEDPEEVAAGLQSILIRRGGLRGSRA